MTVWAFLDKQVERMGTRGWLAIGLYVLTFFCLRLIARTPGMEKLLEIIVQAIVIQGFLGLILAFYFTASKGGVDMAERNQTLIEQQAKNSPPIAPDKDD